MEADPGSYEPIHNTQAITWMDVWEIIHISYKGHSQPAKCLSISKQMSARWAASKKLGFSFKPQRNSSCPFHSLFKRILKRLHLFPERGVTSIVLQPQLFQMVILLYCNHTNFCRWLSCCLNVNGNYITLVLKTEVPLMALAVILLVKPKREMCFLCSRC